MKETQVIDLEQQVEELKTELERRGSSKSPGHGGVSGDGGGGDDGEAANGDVATTEMGEERLTIGADLLERQLLNVAEREDEFEEAHDVKPEDLIGKFVAVAGVGVGLVTGFEKTSMGLLYDSKHRVDFGPNDGGERLITLERMKMGKKNSGKPFTMLSD